MLQFIHISEHDDQVLVHVLPEALRKVIDGLLLLIGESSGSRDKDEGVSTGRAQLNRPLNFEADVVLIHIRVKQSGRVDYGCVSRCGFARVLGDRGRAAHGFEGFEAQDGVAGGAFARPGFANEDHAI